MRAARGAEGLRPGSSDIVSTITQFAILVVLIAILLTRFQRYRPALWHLLPYAAIVVLCFVSTAWSDNPLPTLRRSLSLFSCVLFGAYLQQTWGFRRTITMAGQGAVFLGALSILVFIAAPGIGRETALGYGNAMRGVFSQKNPMAECMLLGVICVCFRMLDERPVWPRAAALSVLLLCIVLGRSATSLALALLVMLATALIATQTRPRLRLILILSASWLAVSALTLLTVAPDKLWALLSRDASLTGRAPLWQEVIQVIAERPLLGHGYAGFWNESSVAVQYLWLRAGWRAPDSHNGYLDVAVQLGFVGLAAYLFLWGRVTWRSAAAYRAGSLAEAPFIVMFMLVNILLNLDEGPMPFSDGFTMLMPGALLATGVWREAEHSGRRRDGWRPVSILARTAPDV